MEQVPKTLSNSSKKIWKDILTEYDTGWNSKDYRILQVGLECLDRLNEIREEINKTGVSINGKPNPLLSCERDARSGFIQAMRQLKLEEPDEKKRKVGRPPNSVYRRM